MSIMSRRDFLTLGSALAVAGVDPGQAFSLQQPATGELERLQQSVNFIYDGSYLTPLEYSHLLMQLAAAGKILPDHYANGGIVAELEHKFAEWLGKERAVFMPTGTLANHIALRELAGKHRRVIVQAESHIYNDSGDCAQTLSGLTLIPLAPNQATFSLEEVQAVLHQTRSGRVAAQVGVIAIESPVRRKNDVMFGYDQMKEIAAFARRAGITLHLDGARLFVESAHTSIAPAQYAELFDSVYVSLYKCFNATAGAIVAGSQQFTEKLYHIRRMFGGGMLQVWPCAAVALQFVDSFIDDYTAARQRAETVFQLLKDHPAFTVEHLPNGTHIVKLHVAGPDLERFRTRLRQRNIHLPSAQRDWRGFLLKINPSLNRAAGQDIAQAFVEAV